METLIIVTIITLLMITILSQWLAKKTKTADVLFFLIGGFVASNLNLLSVENEIIEIFAFIGAIMLFFYLGLEENIQSFIKGVSKGWRIAVAGVVVPFGFIFEFLYISTGDLTKSLIFAMAFAPTSIGIAFLTLQTLQFKAKSSLQPVIVAAALTDDVISLILWGVMGAVLGGMGSGALQNISLGAIVLQSGIEFLMFCFVMFIIAFLFIRFHPLSSESSNQHLSHFFSKLQSSLIRHIGPQRFLKGQLSHSVVILLLLIAFMGAFIAEQFGTSVALGAYFMGLIINDEHITSDHSDESIFHSIVETIRFLTLWLFAPIFFISIGLQMHIDNWGEFPYALFQAFIIALILFSAQFLSASFTARFLERLPWRSSILIGIAMQGRAEVTFLVALSAYSMKLIDSADLLIISLTAFILNLLIPLLLKKAAVFHEKIDTQLT